MLPTSAWHDVHDPGSARELERVSDATCVVSMAAGEQAAVSQLFDRHGARLYGLALCMVGDVREAEDVVAEAFLHAWRGAPSYNAQRTAVPAWLLDLVQRQALATIRARGRNDAPS